jgi:hypothetical protein
MAMKEEIGRTIKDNKEELMSVIVGLTKIGKTRDNREDKIIGMKDIETKEAGMMDTKRKGIETKITTENHSKEAETNQILEIEVL